MGERTHRKMGDRRELKIGDLTIRHPYVLAPMAGVTDLPFRLLCKEQGAGLLCMEMVSAKALQYKNKNTKDLLSIHPEEHPVSLQLFGSEPDVISEHGQSPGGAALSRSWTSTWAARCPRW